jgi:hypothetical protein
MRELTTLALAAALVLLCGPAVAQSSGVADAVFSAIEKRIIQDHFGGKSAEQKEADEKGPKAAADDRSRSEATDEDRDKPKAGRAGRKRAKGERAKPKAAKKGGKKSKAARGGPPKSKAMPPGLARRDELPPGLARRETLPPGLAKRELAADLEAKLPPPPKGTERAIVEDNVVLIERATGKVLDILKGVLTRTGK